MSKNIANGLCLMKTVRVDKYCLLCLHINYLIVNIILCDHLETMTRYCYVSKCITLVIIFFLNIIMINDLLEIFRN